MKSEFYYTSRVYYISLLGAECITLLCSVSRVASASFSFLIFNDVLVSSTLTLPVNIFTWKKKKPCSPGTTKIFVPWAPSVSVLLTSTSLKILKKNLLLVLGGFRSFQVVSCFSNYQVKAPALKTKQWPISLI